MSLRVLIVGASGFVGQHMQDFLRSDFEVIAPHHSVDVRHRESLTEMVANARPDWVIHLAAVSSVPNSFEYPMETYEINFLGTLNLLAALRDNRFAGKFLFVSSSQIYGLQGELEPPFLEDRPPRPVNPYAVSKLAGEALCYQWSQTEDFQIIIARPFNHIGPGQNENFVIPNFARQITEIKRGLREPVLNVGNIDVARDFTDVRDVVRAYRLLLEFGANGESYNVCSGVQTSIRFLIQKLLEITSVSAEIKHGKDRYRIAEQTRMVGNAEKLCRATGWTPQITLEQSLNSILEHCDQAIA
ncbi:MAG: GDP-6-deoxy-D-mannose reductase [Acidobacteriales bacterium]|nr:GDP-6-deoxy-D-mannose reductase [Terriglobales bacterium]